ncbi:Retrovirus-related Pol polyprotein from transposon TNT 1-94 [Phytophthora fragariae]|nr:Retrovirus-related Pol polyprotein from transposon TNT 1-94 [Phytophthora fragariae]
MEVPYAVWYRELPAYSRLRTFGCAVLACVDKVERRKMQSKAREAIFVGYTREKRGYRLLDSKTRKAFYSHTAVFYERKAGRIATGSTPILDTTVPVERYLEMDSAAMENIPAILDEMHEDDTEEDADCESVGSSDVHPDLPGGADDRSARTGGAKGAVARGDISAGDIRSSKSINHCETPQKRTRSENDLAVRGAAPDDTEHLRIENESEQSTKSKYKKRERCRGRRKAPTADASLQQDTSCGESSIQEEASSSETRAMETAGSETSVHRDGPNTERLQTSSCRGLREYVAPSAARTKDCPVTRSGRASKPPAWLGEYIYVAYASSNSDEFASSSVSWEKAREEMQRAMAKEQALAWWQDYGCLTMGVINEPETYANAIESEFSVEWKAAAQAEYNALIKNFTWELVPRQKNMKVLRNRWVFRVKYKADGEIDRFKARLVIKGFMQVYGIDYLEVYSPVVRLETLRVLLTLAAVWDYEIHQMDVTTAFLNGKIDVEVYMEQPDGFKVPGKETWVCRLLKSLYGLKQAPRVWFQLLKSFLEEQGFTLLKSEACVAVKIIDDQLVYIPLYVDDLILFAPNMKLIKEMKQMFFERFDMKDLGELHYILGWEITRNRSERAVFISQRKYAKSVLERFGMEKCNGCKTPCTADLKLAKSMCAADADEKQLMSSKPYRSVVGSLMYLMMGSRPDLAYLVRECSQYLENPGILHWRAAKRGIRYLQETLDWGIRLGGEQWTDQELDRHLEAFADADFANRTDDRNSVAGYLTKFCGSTISWCSQTEKTVALHTTEAEYMALSLLVQEVIHLRQMLKELQVQQKAPTEVFVDNESAKKLAVNPSLHSRTKHIDVRHHFIRERVDMEEIEVLRVPGSENVADAFTKPLSRAKFEKHREVMGLMPRTMFEQTECSGRKQ